MLCTFGVTEPGPMAWTARNDEGLWSPVESGRPRNHMRVWTARERMVLLLQEMMPVSIALC